jgi:hypothetical protein
MCHAVQFYGGIMCQVQVYQLEMLRGTIAMRMTARELKARWQQENGLDDEHLRSS